MNKKFWSFFIVTVLLIIMTLLSATKGSLEVGIIDLVQGIFTGANEDVEVIKDLRFPRIIIALFTGAALAVSGVLFQAVMKNPLADLWGNRDIFRSKFYDTCYYYAIPAILFLDAGIRLSRWCVCVLSRLFVFMEIRIKSASHYFNWYCH